MVKIIKNNFYIFVLLVLLFSDIFLLGFLLFNINETNFFYNNYLFDQLIEYFN